MMSKSKPGKGLHVLVMDDEAGIRSMCREVLEGLGCAVDEAGSIEAAQEALNAGDFQLAIFDVRLPDGSGLDLFHKTRAANPDLCIAIITGHASVEDAIEAVKAGACDYITKPFDIEQLRGVVEIAAGGLPAVADADDVFDFHGIIGVSKTIRSLCALIERAAQAPSTVLIQGESGTGKERIARAIHSASSRGDGAFVAISCAARRPPSSEKARRCVWRSAPSRASCGPSGSGFPPGTSSGPT